MRVLHVGKYYFPYRRGIETYLKTLAEGLKDRCDLLVAVSNTERKSVEEEINGVKVIRLSPALHLSSTDFTLGLPKLIKDFKPDIVHVHLPNPWAETAWKLAGKPKRLFVSFHSDIIRQKTLLKLYAPFHRAFLSAAEKILVATPNHIKYSPFLSKLPPEKLAVVHYGLEAEKYCQAAPEKVAALKEKYGTFALSVGSLVYYKGFEIFIEALRSTPEINGVIVGRGPLKQKLQTQIERANLQKRVFLLDELSEEELIAAYHACESFVLASNFRSEAFGLVQLEAFLASKPVISTNLESGVPYVNQNGKTGLIIPPNDVKALAEALRALHEDETLRVTLGQNARERGVKDFSAAEMIEKTYQLYLS